MHGQPGDYVGDFLFRHRMAGSITSPVRSALVAPAGDHRCPKGLVAHKCEESRIDNRSALRAPRSVFAVASRAIVVEDRLTMLRVARVGVIRGQRNSDKIARP